MNARALSLWLAAGMVCGSSFIDALGCGPFFFQAPPPLTEYPERFAGKDWVDFFIEDWPLPDGHATPAETLITAKLLTERWLAGEEVGEEIQDALKRNREGIYNATLASYLHELAEIAGQDIRDEARDYLMWRLAQVTPRGWEEPSKLSLPEWGIPSEVLLAAIADWELWNAESAAFFDEKLSGDAVGAMRAHWLVQRGAWHFRQRRFTEAAADFESTIALRNPGRMEAALIMLTRSRIEQARVLRREPLDSQSAEALLDDAWRVSGEYLDAFPGGRFFADMLGWRAAISGERGYPAEALEFYIQQLEHQPTREIQRAVYRECDRIFHLMVDQFEESELDVWRWEQIAHRIAAYPALASRFVYLCLDSEAQRDFFGYPFGENFSSDRAKLDLLQRRVLRLRSTSRPILLALGTAMLERNESATLDHRTTMVLAWAATENGLHEQSLALLELASREDQLTDDLLNLQATVALRAGRAAESLVALQRLLELHPESPLAGDIPWRMAVTLQTLGRPAEALMALWDGREMDTPHRAWTPPESDLPSVRIGYEVDQLIDLLLQFSPIDQLLPLLDSDNAALVRVARQVIFGRALASGDFAAAKRCVSAAEDDENFEDFGAVTPEIWQEKVVPLIAWQAEMDSGNPQAAWSLARHWMQHRGSLTMPSSWLLFPSLSEGQLTDVRRRQNATLLGLKDVEITWELDGRDEAWHALNCALKAADLSPELAPAALALANQALFRMAELSIYQGTRAIETRATALSGEIVGRLRREHPGSPEAAAALPWEFPIVTELSPWMPGDFSIWGARSEILKSFLDDSDQAEEILSHQWGGGPAVEALAELMTLASAESPPASDREAILAEIQRIKEAFLAGFTSSNQAKALNALEDFALLVGSPQTADAVIRPYMRMRLAGNAPPAGIEDDPDWQSIRDFMEYWENVRPVVSETYMAAKPNRDEVAAWDEFLKAYPASPKASAAKFRRLRLICRQHRPPVTILVDRWPSAQVPWGYKTAGVPGDESANPGPMLAAIEEWKRDQPVNGDFIFEVKLLEAGAWMDAGEYERAMGLVLEVLDSQEHRDLHMIAILELATISAGLVHLENRGLVLDAFRQHPQAVPILERLIRGDTFLSRLRPMLPALVEL